MGRFGITRMRVASPAMGMAAAEGYCDAAVDGDGVLGLFVSPPAAVVGVPGFVRLGVVPGTCLIDRVRLRMPKESARVAPSTKSFLVCARGWRRAQTHVRVINGNQGPSKAIEAHQGSSSAIKCNQGPRAIESCRGQSGEIAPAGARAWQRAQSLDRYQRPSVHLGGMLPPPCPPTMGMPPFPPASPR